MSGKSICPLCGKETCLIIADRLRHKEKRNVFYCRKCDLGILDSVGQTNSLQRFYQKEYRKKFTPVLQKNTTPKEMFAVYSCFQSNRINLLRKYLTKDTKLLEIGCSAGMFLSQVKKYVGEIAGIDYDRTAAKFASKKCGCNIFDGDIEKAPFTKNYFDVICIFQTLEHIENPYAYLLKAKEYLRPGGILYIEVPNLRDALIHVYHLPCHYNFYFHTAHLWYFTARSLNKLVRKVGFRGKIYFIQDYNIFNHIHWLCNDMPQKNCINGLSRPVVFFRKDLRQSKQKVLTNFMLKIDREYKKLLSKLKITSNLHYLGRKV